MKKRTKKPEWGTHVSPVNWYLAEILLRAEWCDEDKRNPNRRCKVWENTVLIKASSPKEAYTKAMKLGKEHAKGDFWEEGNKDRKGQWHFEGLTSLLAIYDELEDGSEISWYQGENQSVKKIKSWVKTEQELKAQFRKLP